MKLGEITNRTFVLPLVVFFPTSRCNSRCVSCDWWKCSGAGDLSLEEIDAVARALPELGTRIVVFSGGEPLLRPEVFEAAQAFRAQGLTLHLLTSGVLLERCAVDVAREFAKVIVSLDAATEELYHAIRGVTALAMVEKGVARLRDLAPDTPVTARTTVHRLNFRELPRIVDHARAMSLDGISFLAADISSSAFGRDRVPEPHRLALNSGEVAEFQDVVEQMVESHREDFESGFIAESPAKLRRLAAVLRRALRRWCVSGRRVQCAVHVRGDRSGRLGAAVLFPRSCRQPAAGAARVHRRDESAGVSQHARLCQQSRLHEVRLFDEDAVEERAMAIGERALLETRAAFDGVAPTYDRANEDNRTLLGMRQRTMDAVRRHVAPGGHILDLGCGPGRDDEDLARGGFRVTAIDWSPAMVGETGARIRRAGLEDRVQVKHLGIQEIEKLSPVRFDAACSNFGPLNCVPHLPHTARLIANRLRPGGVLVASVIGRFCPWEIALYAARRDWARMRVRFARGFAAVPLDGRTVWTRYYSHGGVPARVPRGRLRTRVAARARACSCRRRTWTRSHRATRHSFPCCSGLTTASAACRRSARWAITSSSCSRRTDACVGTSICLPGMPRRSARPTTFGHGLFALR